MKEVKRFYEEYEDVLGECLEDVKWNLRKNNEKYIELQKQYHEILDKNENLTWVLEGSVNERNLSNVECYDLSKLVQIYFDMHDIEEKEIYFSGCKEAYFFFKKIEILK